MNKKSCVNIVLHELYEDNNHPGRDRTLSLIQSRFYWSRYTRDVDNHFKHCMQGRTNVFFSVLTVTPQPTELVYVDYLFGMNIYWSLLITSQRLLKRFQAIMSLLRIPLRL